MKLKGYKKENKITTKNMLIAFGIIIILMAVIGIYRTYAIYKLQKEYDVIKSKIGEFNNGDVKVAVLVDGEESSYFPTYEDNYKVESIECTNGVTGQWDVVNWRLIIDDMSATSTKCTISFNSSETNEETPIAYSKEELLAMNEEITSMSGKQLANYLYPVGSIYMSTEDDTVEKVKAKFGGTWVKYAEDMTLVGASSTKVVNSTGGSSTVTLTTANLPSHSHTYDKVNAKTDETTLTIAQIPAHRHVMGSTNTAGSIVGYAAVFSSATGFGSPGPTMNEVGGGQGHSHTISTTSTNTGTKGSSTAFSVQNPYTAVYMYKRTA